MSAATTAAVAAAAATSQLWFEQDDDETLSLLLTTTAATGEGTGSGSPSGHDEEENADMKKRLTGVVERFREDFRGSSDDDFWKTMSKSVQELGFRETASSTVAATLSQSSSSRDGTNGTSLQSIPAQFQTDSGKKHIRATCSLLRISETRAVQLTLSALRSLNKTGKDDDDKDSTTAQSPNEVHQHHLSSLLGTRGLLKIVREFHFAQRLSRLRVITECLGIEQDDEVPFKSVSADMLNELDKDYNLDGRKRGLFERLLCVACAPCAPPTRQELLSTLELRSETPETLQQAQLQEYASAKHAGAARSLSDDRFVTSCFQACRMQSQRERVQAMEALLILLYHRIDQGIHRIDYALILLSFQSCGTFFTTIVKEGGKQLPYLAGLICAECMSLWMTSSTEADENGIPLWISRHPLLHYIVVDSQKGAIREIEAIFMLLTKYAAQVPPRKLASLAMRTTPALSTGDTGTQDGHRSCVVQAPESVALFSFAILLRLVQMHVPPQLQSNQLSDFGMRAIECAHVASDDCGVFDYLLATMEALVKTPVQDSFSSVSNVPYDWQFSNNSSLPVLEGPSEQEPLNGASVAYSSIALELLSSTIIGFQSTLRTGNTISLENVTMLCSLASAIVGNHPLLCNSFWRNLEAYTSEATPRQGVALAPNQALCYLVDAAHVCATSTLNAVALASAEQHPGLEEDVLPNLVPLLQLMSSLCSSSGMVDSVLKLLPNSMIRVALLCCVSTKAKDATSFSKNALIVVESIKDLARIGRSRACRSMLRNSLEEEGSAVVDGPRILYRIIAEKQSTSIVSSTLRIVGYFVEDARGHELWVAKVVKYFGPAGLGEHGFSALLTGQSISVALSALHVLSGFVCNMAVIAFCPLCEECDILDVLVVASKGVSAACMQLTTLLSSKQTPTVNGLAFLVAHGILRCSSMFLREIRPICFMHASLGVKSSAKETRDVLIQMLSTSTAVGQAIAYFASAPVSLSLAIVLEEMLQNANVLQIASDEYARESEPLDFGAWRTVIDGSRENKPAVEMAKVRLNAQNLVSNLHELVIDLQGFQSRGWTDEATAIEPLQAASSALDLLRLWFVTVGEIVAEQHGILNGNMASLSQAAASDLRSFSPTQLIFSQIERPPVVEEDNSLRRVWPTDMLCLFNSLIRYIDGGAQEDRSDATSPANMPSLLAADVLCLATTNARYLYKAFHVPAADVVFHCVPQLCLVLAHSSTSAAVVTSAKGPNRRVSLDDEFNIRQGLAGLRLLSACMELDDRVAVAMCGAESSPLDAIVGILHATASLIRKGTSLGQISIDALLTSQLRLTSGSIHALLPLWKSTCKDTNQAASDTVKAVKKSIISDLVTVVEFAASKLTAADVPEEPSDIHILSVLTAATSDALDVLVIEYSKELRVGGTLDAKAEARTLLSGMMKTSFSSLSDAFSKINAAVNTAGSWCFIESAMQLHKHVSVHDPSSVLYSFLAAYKSPIDSRDLQENLCDIVAATSWPSPLQEMTGESGESILKTLNACFILLFTQLNLVGSWARFATVLSATDGHGNTNQATSKASALSATRTVLIALDHVSKVIEEAQMLVAENYLPLDVGLAAAALSGVLVETIGSRFTRSSLGVSPADTDDVVDLLDGLGRTIEKLLSSTCLNRPSHNVISLVIPSFLLGVDKMRRDINAMCCIVQRRLLSSATFIFGALDEPVSSPQPPNTSKDGRPADVALKFVVAACKGLELADRLARSGQSAYASDDLLEASVSLLTLLLARDRGSTEALTGDSLFYRSAAASMEKFHVMQCLVVRVNVASRRAVGTPSTDSTGQPKATVFIADEKQVRLVQIMLSLIHTIAEVGQKSNDILRLLDSASLSKVLVDNPLFVAANGHWTAAGGHGAGDRDQYEQQPVPLRGYVPLPNDKLPVEVPESRTIVTGTFLSGRDDPVHLAWRTALKILQATVKAYTQPQDVLERTMKPFLDTAVAFLTTYYSSLIACLHQCSSLSVDSHRGMMPRVASTKRVSHTVLTFNALSETSDIIALVSSLCNGTNGKMFQNVSHAVYNGMTNACHTVIDGLSKFLAAAGTAKEIFVALKDYDSELQQENASRDQDFRFGFNQTPIETNPLLSAGIPNAKHEAIKHAHYAIRCCAYVTQEDYKGLPPAPERRTGGPFSTSSLERDSQISMNSPFMFRMEHTAAECVSAAIAVLSETHPASNCFVVFSEDEIRSVDMLSLLKKGMVVSCLPEPSNGGDCRFSRIVHVDTVFRKCHVHYLDGPGDQPQTTLPVDRINGLEDLSKRKPILACSAAPTSFAEFEAVAAMTENKASIGDVILTLRWCYQCTTDVVGSRSKRSVRKALAESAAALLCTDISLHGEIGTFPMASTDEMSKRVLLQLLELFDDSKEAPRWSGRLKEVIGHSVWSAIQQQLAGELTAAREDVSERRKEKMKRADAMNGSSPWYNASRQHADASQPSQMQANY